MAELTEGAGDLALDDGGVLLEPLQEPAAGGVGGPGFGQNAAGDFVVLGGVAGKGLIAPELLPGFVDLRLSNGALHAGDALGEPQLAGVTGDSPVTAALRDDAALPSGVQGPVEC